MKVSLLFALLGQVLTVAVAAGEAQPARALEIVDQSIAFHGGKRYEASATTLDLCSKSGCFQVGATLDSGRFVLEASREDNGRLRVRIDNETVSVWQDGQVERVAPGEAQRRRDWVMQRVYFAFLPYRLNDPSVWKVDLGLETWGGRQLHKVKVTFAPGSSTDADDAYMYWFEPGSGRLVQFAYSYDGSPGGLRFRKVVNERRIGGILFFDQENYGAEGNALKVENITPTSAAAMPLVSIVRLQNISVRKLVD